MSQMNKSNDAAASKEAGASTQNDSVTLPPNVSIYNGPSEGLFNGKLFTRLETTVEDPAKLTAALASDCAAFCMQHKNVALIFDGDDQDLHHEHFRQVCLKLKEHDLGLQYGSCTFDAESALQAGFQLDKLSGNATLIIDLQHQDDDEDEEDDDDDDDIDLEALGLGGLGLKEAPQ